MTLSSKGETQFQQGVRIFSGHIGTIYQAHNGIYLGRGTPRTLRLRTDDSVLSDRAIQKLRARESVWRYAADQLIAAGADPPDSDLRVWTRLWVERLTRPLRHWGNHEYLHHSFAKRREQRIPSPCRKTTRSHS